MVLYAAEPLLDFVQLRVHACRAQAREAVFNLQKFSVPMKDYFTFLHFDHCNLFLRRQDPQGGNLEQAV